MMKKAIFLDRDGTINNNCDHYYIWRKEELLLNPGVGEALAELRSRGYMLIVITNQGGISKGEFTARDVDLLHVHLRSMLARAGISLDEVYYCPHHSMVESCLCRKPQPLMIEKALARFGIDTTGALGSIPMSTAQLRAARTWRRCVAMEVSFIPELRSPA